MSAPLRKKGYDADTVLLDRIRHIQRGNPWNKRCADCTEVGPTYICMDYGTFVCTTCSGLHRELNHKVKGVSVSRWTEREVEFIESHGNEEARKNYMAAWNPNELCEPEPNDPDSIRTHLKKKYHDKRWCPPDSEKGWFQHREAEVSSEEVSPRQIPRSVAKASIRKKRHHREKKTEGAADDPFPFAIPETDDDPFSSLGPTRLPDLSPTTPWSEASKAIDPSPAPDGASWAAFGSSTPQDAAAAQPVGRRTRPVAPPDHIDCGTRTPLVPQRFSGDPFTNFETGPFGSSDPSMQFPNAGLRNEVSPQVRTEQALKIQQSDFFAQMDEIQEGIQRVTGERAAQVTSVSKEDPFVAAPNLESTKNGEGRCSSAADFSDLVNDLWKLDVGSSPESKSHN